MPCFGTKLSTGFYEMDQEILITKGLHRHCLGQGEIEISLSVVTIAELVYGAFVRKPHINRKDD